MSFDLDASLLELDSESSSPARPAAQASEPRALIALDVRFASVDAARTAYRWDNGGALAVSTNVALAKGTLLSLRLTMPGWNAPVRLAAKVSWSRMDALGLALLPAGDDERARLANWVVQHTTVLERARSRLVSRVEQPATATVAVQRAAVVQVEDALLSDAVSELLDGEGFVALPALTGSWPQLLVADARCKDRVRLENVPSVVVNADAVGARKGKLACVPAPVTPMRVLQAVRAVCL